MAEQNKQGYILRYYLPVMPNFDKNYTDLRFDELLSFCQEADICAVMFYVALDPNFYYMPDTPNYAKEWRDFMLPYIQRLKEYGISYQLNFQNLIGATLSGVDFRYKYDWEYMVDYKGVEIACACPLGEKFRKDAASRLKVWAETKPDVIWIDDDLRLHGHGAPTLVGGDYVDFYCFCDKHLQLFNQRYNTAYDRESLVAEILKAGKPTKARKDYLQFLSDTMAETAGWISSIVHSVSPNTVIAQMTSAPDSHAAEGRNWGDFLHALSNGKTPVLRPTFGPYQEYCPRDFISSYSLLSQIKANVEESYNGKVEYCPEVENTRFTVWSKSAAATSFQLALSAFMGCKNITLSIFDLDGGAIFDEPSYGKMLKAQKPFLDKLAELNLDEGEGQGVVIPTSGNSGKLYNCKCGDSFGSLRGGRSINGYLMKCGVPCVFKTPDKIGKETVALDSYTANFLPDEYIKKILCGSVFMDGGAAEILIERGYSDLIGITKVSKKPHAVQSEKLNTFTRKDGTKIRIPSRIPPNCSYLSELKDGANVLSEFISPEGKIYPATVTFNNKNGGKIAVYLAKNNWGDGFYTHHRVRFIKDLLNSISNRLDRLDCQSYVLFATSKNGDKKYYFIANLSSDTQEQFVLNGIEIEQSLKTYQAAVYQKSGNKYMLIGITK